jgi:hypothetical protein
MTARLWWANLDHSSPRYAEWYRILETDDVPLLSPMPVAATLGQLGPCEVCQVYLLDFSRLSQAQTERLVASVAKKFDVTEELVASQIICQGFPVRAIDVVIGYNMRAFA